MSTTKKAIVSVTNDLYTDQRVNKICLYLTSIGYEVLLVGRVKKDSLELAPRAYDTKRFRLIFEKGALFYATFNLRLFLFLLFKKVDLLVSNDLDTLLANYTAKKIKRKTRLVYDSHEFFTEVPELTGRPKVQRVWERIEAHIFPSLTSIYTVNYSIAELYEKKYNKEVKVVRNISPRWQPNTLQPKKELGIPENKPLIILQGAGINIDRGAEEAVEAMTEIDAVLMIVGDGDVVAQLKARCKTLALEEKVLFYGKKPYAVMMNYTHYADIGLTLDKATNLNYKLSLPNKVFDYMHTETPIVATSIKEVANVIRKHNIGEIIDDFSVKSLRKTINELLKNQNKLNEYKENCRAASELENWENEVNVLDSIYKNVD